MRAGMVCGKTDLAKIGIDMIASPQLRSLAESYPETTNKWMQEGADNFNSGVMNDGLPAACKFANEMKARVRKSR